MRCARQAGRAGVVTVTYLRAAAPGRTIRQPSRGGGAQAELRP